MHAAAEPPQRSPAEEKVGEQGLARHAPAPVALEVRGAEERRHGEEQATHREAVQHRAWGRSPPRVREEGDACGELQQVAERAREQPPLAHADPHHGGALERPGRRGEPSVEGERDRERGEGHAQRDEGLDQQAQPLAHAPEERERQREVDHGDEQRAVGGGVLDVPHRGGLQAERHHRRAEHQRAVDVVLQLHRPLPCEEDRDRDVHGKEKREERLGARQHLRPVVVRAPQRADAEGEGEAEDVQHAPGLDPGDNEDAGVQHRVVREEHHVAAAPGRGEDRREEAAADRDDGERERVLRDGEGHGGGRHADQEHEGERPGQHAEEAKGGEDDEVQHGDAAALQDERVARPGLAQAPAEGEHHQRAERHRGEAQLDRNMDALVEILDEERDADEQHQDADLRDHVAADQALPEVRAGRLRFGFFSDKDRLSCRLGLRLRLWFG